MIRFILLVAVIWPLFGFTGIVTHVSDGDTITVLADGSHTKVRLYGVDTPEKAQPYGREATVFTRDWCLNELVTVDVVDIDRYGRTVGIVTANGCTLNEDLVRAGWAWVYHRYCHRNQCQDWSELEGTARLNKIGLWHGAAVPPWDWRRRARK